MAAAAVSISITSLLKFSIIDANTDEKINKVYETVLKWHETLIQIRNTINENIDKNNKLAKSVIDKSSKDQLEKKIDALFYDFTIVEDSLSLHKIQISDLQNLGKREIRIFEVVDENKEVQAVATIEVGHGENEDKFILHSLQSAPWNLRYQYYQYDLDVYSKDFDVSKKVEGAGSCAFKHLIEIAKDEKKTQMIGNSAIGATKFYAKMGCRLIDMNFTYEIK